MRHSMEGQEWPYADYDCRDQLVRRRHEGSWRARCGAEQGVWEMFEAFKF